MYERIYCIKQIEDMVSRDKCTALTRVDIEAIADSGYRPKYEKMLMKPSATAHHNLTYYAEKSPHYFLIVRPDV